MQGRVIKASVGVLFLALALGCGKAMNLQPQSSELSSNQSEEQTELENSAETIVVGTKNPLNLFKCNASDPGMSATNLRRLSEAELRASLEVLFGSAVLANASVKAKLPLLKSDPGIHIAENFDNKAERASSLLAIGEEIGAIVFASDASTNALIANCAPSVNTTCLNNFEQFAKRVYRRPLTTDEKTVYRSFIAEMGSTREALKFAVIRLLVSPHFHQQMEIAEGPVSDGRLRLSQFEIASRLAFRLTGAPPDTTIIQAAEAGTLTGIPQLQQQAERLISTARAQKRLSDFYNHLLGLDTQSDPSALIQSELGISPDGLGKEMSDEFDKYLQHVVFTNRGAFENLYTDRTIFPSTQRLARIYGVTQTSAGIQGPPERGGFLLRPHFMRAAGDRTNIVNRGKIIRRELLCEKIPDPDPNLVVMSDNDPTLIPENFSSRYIIEKKTASPLCMSCHASINPPGFALESFGPFGEFRTQQKVFDSGGDVIATFAVDPVVPSLNIAGETGPAVQNSRSVVEILGQSPRAIQCFSDRLHQFTKVKTLTATDGCTINEVSRFLYEGGSVRDALLKNLVNEEIFWRRAP